VMDAPGVERRRQCPYRNGLAEDAVKNHGATLAAAPRG
jgi:hypothetical protein